MKLKYYLFRSIALRKIKTLGPRKSLTTIQPGDYKSLLPLDNNVMEEDENIAEEISAPISYPPFERLILWTDPEDSTNIIEVIMNVCISLRYD